jgi:hypothetical protein
MTLAVQRTPLHFLDYAVGFSHSKEAQVRGVSWLVDYLMRSFGVAEDEVALLVLDRWGENLRFVAPSYLARLKAIIPFKKELSLAGKSLVDRRIGVENRLSVVNHLSFFERAKQGNPRLRRIEKMLTIPICVGAVPVGVVQISHKLASGRESMNDFHRDDATHIVPVERVICRLMQGIQSAGTYFPSAPVAAVAQVA